MRTLKVNGRYLAWDSGEPFFYLADTAWEIFHRLNRQEMQHYFAERSRQGFNAVQGVLLAEFEGVTVPNAYGRLPLLFSEQLPDPVKPDLGAGYGYWDHVDFAIETAAENNLFMVLLPTWGDKFNRAWGKGPEIFNVENAYIYGKWLASRYRDRWNIIWMLGGDRPLEPVHRKIIDAMAAGIREQDQQHLITFHPQGRKQSTTCVGDAPYIDFHTAQSGHTTGKSYLSSDLVMLDMASKTGKPYMDSEPRYEDHPAKDNNGRWDEKLGVYWKTAEVRQNAYWNLMTGVCGHTYGNHCIWSMNRIPTGYFPYAWQEALTHDGAEQMGFVKKLRMSRDYFSLRPAPELLAENFAGMGHMAAAMGDGYAYIYSPLGVPFTVNLDPFDKYDAVRALWFDPRRGSEETITLLPAGGQTLMAPPSQGKGCDWVLVLDTSE